jgi:hypothetical protein
LGQRRAGGGACRRRRRGRGAPGWRGSRWRSGRRRSGRRRGRRARARTAAPRPAARQDQADDQNATRQGESIVHHYEHTPAACPGTVAGLLATWPSTGAAQVATGRATIVTRVGHGSELGARQ